LHPLAVEDAQTGHERPKIEEYGDSLFAVLHLVEPTDGEFHVGELAIFAGSNYVLSVRNNARNGFQDVRARCEREPDLLRHGPGFILYALMDAVADRYFPILELLEDELDAVEASIFAPTGVPRENIESLYALKQRLMVMKHAVAPLLEGISNLSGARVPPLCAGTSLYFKMALRLRAFVGGHGRSRCFTVLSLQTSPLALASRDATTCASGPK